MEPGHTEEHGDQGDEPTDSWSPPPPPPPHDSTQVLPAVPADPPPSFTERSDSATSQLPTPASLAAAEPPAAESRPAPEADFGPPSYQTAAYEQPLYQPGTTAPAGPPPPAYGQPAYGQPTYDQPAYGQPAYGQPAYGQPSYGQPTYDQPAYQQQPPAYPQPAYQQPYQAAPTAQPYGQPAYEQPSYQQPTAAYGTGAVAYDSAPTTGRPRKSHKGLWSLLVVVVVIAAAVGVLFAVKPSPLFKKVLDNTSVEQTIESQSQNGAGNYTNVSCPSNEKVKAGTTFECTASGNKRISVTINDSKGNYEWKPVG